MSASYYDSAQGWDSDVYRALERSRRRAWLVAATSSGFTLLALLGLVLLIPLRQTVPYVITKDSETGYVEVARAADSDSLTRDEALSEFNVIRYVAARETYDPTELQTNYEVVYAASDSAVWQTYDPLYRRGVPGNLVEKYGRQTTVSVSIKNVSFLEPDLAFVRFSTTKHGQGGQEHVEHWGATVRFRYVPRSGDLVERVKNPLGFQVTTYRRDQEVIDGGE